MLDADVLTQREVAERLGIAVRTLRQWVQDDYFPPPMRVGRKPYYSEQVVKDWIDDRISCF